MRFLDYIVSHQDIQIEEEQIKAIHNWSELQSVYDLHVHIGFANFYRQFIQRFSRLAASLSSMLKTTLAAGPAVSAEVGDKKQDGKGIQVENRDEKKPVEPEPKSCKG